MKGFFIVITLDRFEELRKFLLSLSKFHKEYPISIWIAKNVDDVFRIKTKAAILTPFNYTVVIDTDMYINGKLDYLFKVAENNKVGIVRHKDGRLNAGLIVFAKDIMLFFSKKWNQIYEERLKQNKILKGEADQSIFNEFASELPLEELPFYYNATFHDITPEDEKKYWNKIKIFHFLHSKAHVGKVYFNKNDFRSWQEYQKL